MVNICNVFFFASLSERSNEISEIVTDVCLSEFVMEFTVSPLILKSTIFFINALPVFQKPKMMSS